LAGLSNYRTKLAKPLNTGLSGPRGHKRQFVGECLPLAASADQSLRHAALL
jgi:hypothetical protein